MFNVGGGEVLVILLVALIVLGPDKLPNAARQAGKYLGEFRRMSSGFQQELRDAMDLPGVTSAGDRTPSPGPTLPPLETPTPPVAQVMDAGVAAVTPAVAETLASAETQTSAGNADAADRPVSRVPASASPTLDAVPSAPVGPGSVRPSGPIDVDGPSHSFS